MVLIGAEQFGIQQKAGRHLASFFCAIDHHTGRRVKLSSIVALITSLLGHIETWQNFKYMQFMQERNVLLTFDREIPNKWARCFFCKSPSQSAQKKEELLSGFLASSSTYASTSLWFLVSTMVKLLLDSSLFWWTVPNVFPFRSVSKNSNIALNVAKLGNPV